MPRHLCRVGRRNFPSVLLRVRLLRCAAREISVAQYQTKALSPVIDFPTINVFISLVPS